MLHRKRFVSFVVLSFVSFVAALTQRPGQMPRFRAGANLVRVDAYVSKDDVALTDLKAEDFEVFEDDKPQQIENFELVTARAPNPQSERHRSHQRARHATSRSRMPRGCSRCSSIASTCSCPARITRASRSSKRSIA